MTEDGVTSRYELLRAAAIRVLEAVPDVERPPGQLSAALEGLRDAVRGEVAPPDVGPRRPLLDPFRHYLTEKLYVDRDVSAIPLEQMAADLRRDLDGDRALDDRLPGEPERNVVVTELRGMVVGGLLQELAARLSPGAAFGPGRNGEPLARVARDLAKELLDQTFVGEQ